MSSRFKVVLLGEGRVGKTSILLRFVRGEYTDKQKSTLQASYLDKRLPSGAQLSIWDTAGQERFHALGPIYYRDADGALLVYDITDYESFAKVQKWVRELRSIVGSDIAITIAGNKYDLEKNRVVPEEEALRYAATVGATHIYTSAKQNKGLQEAFEDLTQRMMKRRKDKRSAEASPMAPSVGPAAASRRRSSQQGKIVIVDDPTAAAPQQGGGKCGC